MNQMINKINQGGKKKTAKKYVCHVCGLVRDRKPDITGHLQKVHGVGDPKVCNRPPCTGSYRFSTKGALKKTCGWAAKEEVALQL